MNGGAGGMVRCTTTSRHCNIASWARSRTCTRRHTQWCYSTWHRRRKIPGGRSRCIVYGCGCGQMELRIWLWFNIRGPDQQIHVYIYMFIYMSNPTVSKFLVNNSQKATLKKYGKLVVWDSNRVPLSNNPFHKGMPHMFFRGFATV